MGVMPKGLVLADDATGALECASLLANLGLAGLSLDAGVTVATTAECAVLVADTETRHLPAEAARECIERWTAGFTGRIYKKTDSTLRGNIAAELVGLAATVVYIPAYPALGRTVKDGRLFVHGVPVDQTDFARDPRHPVRSAAIAELFPPGSTVLIREAAELHAQWSSGKVLICDAESPGDFDQLERALRGQQVAIAGPAGFIPAWARLAGFPDGIATPHPPVRDWLVVCGSLHPQSRRQAEVAAAAGVRVISSSAQRGLDPAGAAEELAERAVEAIRLHRPQGVLVMGGDTAWALWRALAVRSLTPLPEVLPGVAVCQSGDLVFVTKAGGFGDDNLVSAVREKFQ